MYPSCEALLQVLKPSPQVLPKKCEDVRDNPGEFIKQQLMREHILETWVEQPRSATPRNLRRVLDINLNSTPINVFGLINAIANS